MIICDLFFESGSNEATKINKILQRYVIYISDQITVPYLNTETGNRRLNIVEGVKCTRRKENECVYGHIFLALKTSMSISSDSENIFDII
jgi:hypothetical protein